MFKKLPLLIGMATLLGGCAIGDFEPAPAPEAPPSYRNADAAVPGNLERNWWRMYQDPVLDHLVESILERNPYTAFGELHVAEAEAGVDATSADLLPQLGFGAGVDKSHSSTNTPLGELLGNRTIDGKTYRAGVNAGWQLDLWGRIAQAVEVARAHQGMAEATRRSVEIILSREVAVAYWQFRTAEADQRLLQQQYKAHAEALRLLQLRLDAGLETEQRLIEVRVAQAGVEAEIEAAEVKRLMAEQELAILMVEPVQDFRVATQPDYALPDIPRIAPGLPATILSRRPDLMMSAQELRALLAMERIAETAFYPSISLTGAFGFASTELRTLSDNASREYSLGPLSLYLPVFDAGRNRANLKVARARYRQAVNVHKVNVLIALREVDDALVQVQAARTQVAALGNAAEAGDRGTVVAEARYDQGQDSYLKVLEARVEALETRRKQIHSHSEGLLATAHLVEALGGGWDESGAGPTAVASND
ncbi:MAG: TolC family protein [Oceanospirillaceae bacterium]|nr:TolC family protein [Oceanospirillaceae bacterium]